jgi:DNA-binding CsgD family transcriptional regulator
MAGYVTQPLDRGGELQELRARLEAAVSAGTGSTAVVAGPAGVGKTTLLRALTAGAAGGSVRVLSARGAELERELPFGVVRQLIERPALALATTDRDALLAGPASPIRALLDATVDEPAETAAAVAHGLYWVLARLADAEPLCAVVDDVHWGDQASADALAYVGRRLEGHPMLLVCAARDDEPDAIGWRRLEAIDGARTLRPPPLSEAGCAELVRTALGDCDPAFASACHHVTAGNPRQLTELLAACRDEGIAPDAEGAARVATLASAAVGRMVLERIARIAPDAVELARAIAVLDHARQSDAAVLAGLDGERAAAVAERLVAAGVLSDELPLRFAHPLTRATVEADMTDIARDRAHRRAARLLAPRDPDGAALHLLLCEPAAEPWAVHTLHAAARDALRQGTPAAAVRLLDRALAEGGAPDIRGDLTRALLAAGDPRAASELLAALDAAGDLHEQARLAALTGQAQIASGDGAGGLATLRLGLAAAERVPRSPASVDLVFAAATFGADDPEMQASAARLARLATGDPRLEAFEAFEGFRMGRPASETARHAGAPLAELSRLTGADIAPTFHMAIWALAGCDEIDAAEAALDGAFELARERGSRLTYGLACFLRLWCRWRRGDVRGVLADVEETLAFAAEGWAFVIPNARWLEAECGLLRGDVEGCRAALDHGFRAAEESGWGVARSWLLHGRAGLRLRTGDPAGALDDALRCGALLELWRSPSPAVVDWRGRAVRAAMTLGDVDRARSIASDCVRLAEIVGAARTLALAYRAEAHARTGEARIERLREAADVAARGPSPLVRATVLADLGAALRRARRPREAREPLRQALHLAREAGATALADDARVELDATGARRQAERAWGIEALTPREHELARLAARDLSNTEIAERLFITRKTVESHLSAIYRKLDIGSRRQLARELERGV